MLSAFVWSEIILAKASFPTGATSIVREAVSGDLNNSLCAASATLRATPPREIETLPGAVDCVINALVLEGETLDMMSTAAAPTTTKSAGG